MRKGSYSGMQSGSRAVLPGEAPGMSLFSASRAAALECHGSQGSFL